jgi:hypothetical protein
MVRRLRTGHGAACNGSARRIEQLIDQTINQHLEISMSRFLQTAATCLILMTSTFVHATPVSYVLAGTASGTLDGTAFNGVQFSITGTSDTDLLESPSADIGLMPLQSIDIDLAGIGLVEAVHKTYFFVNRSASLAGFLDQLDGDFIDLAAPGFKTYDGVTSTQSLPVDLDYAGTLGTSAGTLAISDMTAFLTVTGIHAEVPEPNTAALMAIACAAFAATRRKAHPMRRDVT